MDPALMDKEANLAGMIDSVEQAVARQARLVVFPECALTGYCFESLQEALPYAESIPGPSTQLLAGLCHRTRAYLVLGMLEKDGDRCFNAAVLIGPEGVVGKYRKVHLPCLGVDRFVDPGDLGFGVYRTPLGRIGLNICYDGSFPESARIMALQGADIILLPTNWTEAALEFAEFWLTPEAWKTRCIRWRSIGSAGRGASALSAEAVSPPPRAGLWPGRSRGGRHHLR